MGAITKLMTWYLRVMIALIAVYYLAKGDYFVFLIGMVGFFISLLPLIVNAVYNVRLHWVFELAFSIMLFGHIFGFWGAYETFPLWDDAGHLFVGAIMALIGFAWLYSMDVSKKISMNVPMIGLVSVMWSTTFEVIWEILEFTWDSAQGLSGVYGLSQNGLVDTMTDLSLSFIGAICMVLVCIYIVRNANRETERIINPFVSIIEKRDKK